MTRSSLAATLPRTMYWVPGRVTQGGHPPRVPTDPGLRVEDAPGSSSYDFATPPIEAVDHAGCGKPVSLFQP